MEARKKKMESMHQNIESDSFYYPETLRFTAEQLPEIKNWQVGKEYEITIKVAMKSYEERNSEMDGQKKEKKEARFEVVSVKSNDGMTAAQKKIADHMSYGKK